MLIVALTVGGCLTVALINHIKNGTFPAPEVMILMLAGVPICAAMLILGIKEATRRDELTITPDLVTVSKQSIFGRREWRTPLKEYKGVLRRTEIRGGKAKYIVHILNLHHADTKRVVCLYESGDAAVLRVEWERASRSLGRPALTLEEGGAMTERPVTDLDRPVRELVSEGHVAVQFDVTHPPKGLTFCADGDALVITSARRLQSTTIHPVICTLAISAAVFLPVALVFGVAGMVFGPIIVATFVWWRLAREQLRVSRDAVSVRFLGRWGSAAERSMPASSIEMVRVGPAEEALNQTAVRIESDLTSLAFGSSLSPEAKEWVKNCILHVLAM